MANEYLKLRHNTYSVVVEIPKGLRKVAGQARFTKSLGTSNLAEANRLKWPHVGDFQSRIDEMKRGQDPKAAVLRSAAEWRDALHGASREEDERGASLYDELLDQIKELSRQLAEKDPTLASVHHQIATGTGSLIKDHYATWTAESDVAEQTKVQHISTVKRLLTWAGDLSTVESIDRKRAGEYVSELLANSGLARRTVKRHLSSLSQFWQWMEARGIGSGNPWLGHKLGKKKPGAYRHGLEDEAILRLLRGSYSTERYRQVLADAIRLALVTGARLDEICAMLSADAHKREDGWWLVIRSGKTDAASRELPLHPVVVPIVERRLKDKDTFLFKGLLPGGPDDKRSWYVSKAYGRYRASKGVDVTGKGRDFHTLRATFIELMEGLEVAESTTKLLVGHKRESLTYGLYSKGQRVGLRDTVNKLDYGKEIMEAIAS